VIGLVLAAMHLLWGCDTSTTEPSPQEGNEKIQLAMDLQPALDRGFNVTRVHVTISHGGFTAEQDLEISGTHATGTFNQLEMGAYDIVVEIFDGETLIALGDGNGEVIGGQVTIVEIAVTFLGGLQVNVNWGTSPMEWQRHPDNPLIGPGFSGGSFDAGRANHPIVLPTQDLEGYQMWYTGWTPDRGSIGYATSTDGVNWTPHDSEPVIPLGFAGSYDSWHAHRPTVFLDDGVYKMYYAGDSYGQNYTCYATSTDGVNWTSGGMIIDWVTVFGTSSGWARYTYAGSVRKEDGLYRMWFSTGYPNSYIGYATSADGINWSIHDQVLGRGEPGSWDGEYVRDPDVLLIGDTYHMFYSGYGEEDRFQVGMATSADGITWTKSTDNPILRYGASGTWEDNSIQGKSVLAGDDVLRMWYDAHDGSAVHIGLATAALDELSGTPGQ